MAYPALAVANEFIELADRDSNPVTAMKLQKLVYFAHGWYLALMKNPLLLERFQAWQFGPVVYELYQQFKHYGSLPITEPSKLGMFIEGKMRFVAPRVEDFATNDDDLVTAMDVIRRVWDVYGKYSAVKLSNATHAPGTPWFEVYKEGSRNTVIPDAKIMEYFESKMPNAEA